MGTRRFKVDDLRGPVIKVGGKEAVHALRVLRLGVGTEVVVFDGSGGEAHGTICDAGRSQFEVAVTSRQEVPPGASPSLVLAVAAPKGRRGDWLVEKCAELGVRALWLLRTERGEVRAGAMKIDRWRQKAIEAAKQSQQAVTMTIEPDRTIGEVGGLMAGVSAFYGDPQRARGTLLDALLELPCAGSQHGGILVFVGPEGGFSDDERAEMDALGGRAVSLGGTILRVETAAMAAASVWAAWVAGHRMGS